MGSIPNKNEPKKPKITLDNANLGKRLKEYDELPDEPKKPNIKPTVIKPLLGEYDAIAKANTPKKTMPEPTVIKPLNSFSADDLPKAQTTQVKTVTSNIKKPIIKMPKAKTTADDLADIWSEQEKIKLAREAEEKRQKAEKKAQKQAKKLAKKQKKLAAKKSGKPKEININLKAPSLKNNQRLTKAKQNFSTLSTKNKALAIGLITVPIIVITSAVIVKMVNNNNSSSTAAKSGDSSSTQATTLPKVIPSFDLKYPNGDKQKFINNVVRVSPEGREPVYAFVDSLGGVKINVSQQKLPVAFKADLVGSLKKMATDFQATQAIVFDGQIAYQGKNATDGVQSVIYSKDNILFLIRSESVLPDEVWVTYLKSLN